MTVYIALLRAVNVGGTGKLPMNELTAMCTDAGFESVKTYIASGNVVFTSKLAATSVKKKLEATLQDYAGKPVAVLVRKLAELEAVLANNPFPDGAPNQTLVLFLDRKPVAPDLSSVTGVVKELLSAGTREIYINYVDGIARSKLNIPAATTGTARNMNTVRKLVTIAQAL